MFDVAWKLENTAPSVIVMGFHSSATVNVKHDALWEIQTVQGGQTSENLDTALVRHVAQTEIVVVVEVGALLPADFAHPDVRHGTRLGVSSCCFGAGTTRSRCGVCDVHTRGHVCTCLSRCRVCDSSPHRRLRSSSYLKNSGDNSLPNSDDELSAPVVVACQATAPTLWMCSVVYWKAQNELDDNRHAESNAAHNFSLFQQSPEDQVVGYLFAERVSTCRRI